MKSPHGEERRTREGRCTFQWTLVSFLPRSLLSTAQSLPQLSLRTGAPSLGNFPSLGNCVSFCAQVWRIENLELVPVEHRWYGFFYGGDCYLVLYTYEVNGKPHYVLYTWQVGLKQALSSGC